MRREVTKVYTAIVKGHVDKDEFEIDAPIADMPGEGKKMCIGTFDNPGRVSSEQEGFRT